MEKENLFRGNPDMPGNTLAEEKTELKKFILNEIRQPREKWSDEFKAYVEGKKEEARQKELDDSPELSPEENQTKTYNDYLKDLNIEDAENYFKDKDIIDLGCGEGEFVLECLKKGGIKSIKGMDRSMEKDLSEGPNKANFIRGDFTEEFPFEKADIIVSNGGLSTLSLEKDGGKKFEEVLRNSLNILDKNGEIRIAPLHFYHHSNAELSGIENAKNNLPKILDKLTEESLIEYKLEPIDIQVSGKNYNDVWLWQSLTIRKK